MPILKSAKKKFKQDKKRAGVNKIYRKSLRQAVKLARKEKTAKAIRLAYSALDKAAKKKVIHRNKAARLKSGLMKLAK